jgi:hypothetical protein
MPRVAGYLALMQSTGEVVMPREAGYLAPDDAPDSLRIQPRL